MKVWASRQQPGVIPFTTLAKPLSECTVARIAGESAQRLQRYSAIADRRARDEEAVAVGESLQRSHFRSRKKSLIGPSHRRSHGNV
jgi:hypothetical protein